MLGQTGLGLPNLAALGTGTPGVPAQNVDIGIYNNAQTFYVPVLALEAAQNLTPAFFDEGDIFYEALIEVVALPGQILISHFDDPDQLYSPAFALEAAKNIAVGYFADPDVFYTPQIFGEATDLTVVVGHLDNTLGYTFHLPTFVVSDKEPIYTYPIGRGMYSDYGIRAAVTHYKRRMIIGRR